MIVQNGDAGKALSSPDDDSATSKAFNAIADKVEEIVGTKQA
jgi:hypothetical protein